MTAREEAADLMASEWQRQPTASVPDGPLLRYRARWVRWWLARTSGVGDIPVFGSVEWAKLAHDDPRKVASAVRAADAWARQGDDLAFTVAAEEYERRRADDAYWRQVHAGRRGIVDHLIDRITVNVRRTARMKTKTDRARTGREYPGGCRAVDWETGRLLDDAGSAENGAAA